MNTYYSNGKLLLTAEYGVLDGALALAIPTKYGQELHVSESNSSQIAWKSFDERGNIWFEATLSIAPFLIIDCSNSDIAQHLLRIFIEAHKMNHNFLSGSKGCIIETKIDFPRIWGLGTSSTLINNMAQWAEVNAFELLNNTFGGSGYDIACAQNNRPILYQLKQGKAKILKTTFTKDFNKDLYFVHLNKKQNSSTEIASYNTQKIDKLKLVEKLSSITNQIINCKNLIEFELLLNIHETIIASVLKRTPVKKLFFEDYKGAIKSLGAWGGDFVLATGDEDTPDYFKKKGYTTVIPFNAMILSDIRLIKN
ncbi:GYDIA family GHMP kinase [Aurantibacter sp.]|uniref:GYDIA family GHMP kinase n=1 Tax=Aurantibacter sp. TaxID=2807103 RepID=UPI003263FD44